MACRGEVHFFRRATCLIAPFAGGTIFSRCSPADPVHTHFMFLVTFRADAINLHFVIEAIFIEFMVVIYINRRQPLLVKALVKLI